MNTYLFELHYQNSNLTAGFNYHRELFACDADAMVHARKVLKEGKRDVNAFLISVYRKQNGHFKHVVSYQ